MGNLGFAGSISNLALGSTAFSVMSACEMHGMTYGCENCPIFESGDCELEDVDAFLKMVYDDYSDELDHYLDMYPELKQAHLKVMEENR